MKKGFTLLESVIALAIVAIVFAVVASFFSGEYVTANSGSVYKVEMINGHKYYSGFKGGSPSHAADCPCYKREE